LASGGYPDDIAVKVRGGLTSRGGLPDELRQVAPRLARPERYWLPVSRCRHRSRVPLIVQVISLVLVDNNLGGIAKDIIAGADRERLIEALGKAPDVDDGAGELRLEEIGLPEAAARCREALWRTAHTLDPPVAEDFDAQVAALTAHLKMLSREDRFEAEEISEEEREAALNGFLASPEAKPFQGGENVVDLAQLAVDYGAEYVGGEGRPLRWSPRSIPEILPAWVRYAGRSRGIPKEAIEAYVEQYNRGHAA